MAINIIAELEKSNELIGAIRSMAQVSLDQAFPDNEAPNWAVVISLLGRQAAEELENLHQRLTSALTHPCNAPHA
jgi:hypothetical protein